MGLALLSTQLIKGQDRVDSLMDILKDTEESVDQVVLLQQLSDAFLLIDVESHNMVLNELD